MHGSPVRIALFSPDGSQIVSGGFDGTIRVWDAEDGSPIGLPHRLGSLLLDLAFSPDGTRIATGATEGNARIWRLEGGRLHRLALLAHRGPVRRVAFSPDGTRLATASHDGTARVWDGRTGDPLTAPLAHTHDRWVSDAEFSPDGTRLATAGQDGTARVWDAHTGRLIEFKEAAISHSIGIGEASFSPDGARVVTAGFDGTARIWDAVSGEPLSPPFYHGGSVLAGTVYPGWVPGPDGRLGFDRPPLERDGHRRLGGRRGRGRGHAPRHFRPEGPAVRHGRRRRDRTGLGRRDRRGGHAPTESIVAA